MTDNMKQYTHPNQRELFFMDFAYQLRNLSLWYRHVAEQRGFSIHLVIDTDFETHGEHMAQKSKNTRQAANATIGEWVGFATIDLTDSDRKAIPAYAEDWDLVEDTVASLLQSDYKFTVKWDERSDCYMLSVSCYNPESANFKQTLVTRAPSLKFLFATAMYKHTVIANGVWGDNEAAKWG